MNEILLFKKELAHKILYKEYESVEKFESLFRLNLSGLIHDKFINKQVPSTKPREKASLKQNKYTDIV